MKYFHCIGPITDGTGTIINALDENLAPKFYLPERRGGDPTVGEGFAGVPASRAELKFCRPAHFWGGGTTSAVGSPISVSVAADGLGSTWRSGEGTLGTTLAMSNRISRFVLLHRPTKSLPSVRPIP